MPYREVPGYGKCWHAPGRCKSGDTLSWNNCMKKTNTWFFKKIDKKRSRARIPGRRFTPMRHAYFRISDRLRAWEAGA